jgi:Uma2 family endonuclease
MSTIQKSAGVRPKRWTKDEYYRLGELGFFHGQRVELIEGRLMVHSPQNYLHANIVNLAQKVLLRVFPAGYDARCQLPIDLGQTTEPEPDVSVVVGTLRPLLNGHPTSAVLIVEISDTTLSYDRNRKGSLYARAGIKDYWIVNVTDRQLEVYRDPQPDPTAPLGYSYRSRTVLRPPDTVSPLELPQTSIAVAELLP